MMNNIDDMFQTKWVKTYSYGLYNHIISINDKGEMYAYDLINNFELKNKKVEILSDKYLYSNDTKKYYSLYSRFENVYVREGKLYKKAIPNIDGTSLIAITEDDEAVISRFDDNRWEEMYLNDMYPEIRNIKWNDVQDGNLLISSDNKQYICGDYGVYDLEALLNGIKVKKIVVFTEDESGEVQILAITEDGKLIIKQESQEPNILPFDKEIDIFFDSGFIETTDGEFYIVEDLSNIVKIDEMFPELKGLQIKEINGYSMPTIITEDGECYAMGKDNCINIKDIYSELKNKKIIDSANDVLLTNDGQLYDIRTGTIISEDITEVKDYNNSIMIKFSDGYEGLLTHDNDWKITIPNIDNTEKLIQTDINTNEIKQMVEDYILLNNGQLYEAYIEGNTLQMININDKYLNGKKVNYIAKSATGSSNDIIDEDYNIYRLDYDGVYDRTDDMPELKENKVQQIDHPFAIVENGRLVVINDSYNFSNEAEEIINNTKFTKISINVVLNERGEVYLTVYDDENEMIDLQKINDKFENKKIIDIDDNTFLTDDGNVYFFNIDNGEYSCLNTDGKSSLYGKNIKQISSYNIKSPGSARNTIISCIDVNGEKIDNIFISNIESPA